MPYYAVFYDVVDDFIARRALFREEHLRRVSASYSRGELILGGALAEPADGALLVSHVNDRQIVESFVRDDPYVVSGLVRKWEVRPWNVVTGKEASPGPVVPSHPMEIMRRWTARTSKELWPRYREYFTGTVLRELCGVAGYLGATLSIQESGEHCEILVETYWRSLDAVKTFAGGDLDRAVVAAKASEILTDYDHFVKHYEIAVTDRVG